MGLLKADERMARRARTVWWVRDLVLDPVGPGLLALCNWLWWPKATWGWWVVGVVAALALVDLLVGARLRWRTERFGMTEHALISRSGLLWVTELAVPYARVQTVELSRGPVEQRLGLASVEVRTASDGASVSIGPLELDRAEALVRRLTAAAGKADAS